MRTCLLIISLLSVNAIYSQSLQRLPDSIRKSRNPAPKVMVAAPEKPTTEQAIKDTLVSLALQNPMFTVADASIRIAELNRKRANSTWLSQINAGANVNEFVINGSAAASFFPKYNLGVSIPFDVVQRTKHAKTTAQQSIVISQALKQQQVMAIRAEVLTRYENFKEKKQLVELQKISMETDLSAYENAQIDYADGVIKIADMNKAYQSYIVEKSNLVSRERELNVAILQLEEIIGVPLGSIINI